LLLFALTGSLQAGQIEAPLSGEIRPGAQTGAIGSSLGAPLPIQLSAPSLTASVVPGVAPAPAPALSLIQPAAVRPEAVLPLAANPAAIPALPGSAVASVRPRAVVEKSKAAPSATDSKDGTDAGRILFDAGGATKPKGFDRGPGKVIDPNLLSEKVYTPGIMRAARKSGLVFELNASSLKKMKPGVRHNFVIVQNPNGTIAMTVGRVASGNDMETGVKHVALGEGRAVLFSGETKIDAATGRPTLDFNSGMYSQVGLDPLWAPTPENARALAAHAEAILGTRVDVIDHFTNRPIDFRGP
jgi:hypothetical protein